LRFPENGRAAPSAPHRQGRCAAASQSRRSVQPLDPRSGHALWWPESSFRPAASGGRQSGRQFGARINGCAAIPKVGDGSSPPRESWSAYRCGSGSVTVADGAANRANSGIASEPPIRPSHARHLTMRIAYPQTVHSKPYTPRARDRDTLAEQIGRGSDCLLMDSNACS
jgi:hypothetical protein